MSSSHKHKGDFKEMVKFASCRETSSLRFCIYIVGRSILSFAKRLFWGEQPPLIPVGVGGRSFYFSIFFSGGMMGTG